MHKIGILSDTHGMLRPEVKEALKGSEQILHGGDINKQEILDELEGIAPVIVVRGNNDKEWAADIPETVKTDLFGLNVFLVHNRKMIPKDYEDIQLVVFGHSHKYEEKRENGTVFLNPGSCGPRRFHQEITLALLYLDEDLTFRIEKVLIPHKEKKTEELPSKETVGAVLPGIMQDIRSGKTVRQIARKYQIPEELSEQITRMVLTHPGVDTDGVLRRIGL